jgi:hypothetical protein
LTTRVTIGTPPYLSNNVSCITICFSVQKGVK